MKLIIGLGNPSAHFDGTRHNAGFMVLDTLAAAQNLEWQAKKKFHATIAEGVVAGEKTILAKPTTFYNLSGTAAQAIANFYKIDAADILVVHDELALLFGTVRARIGGSDAGNNGIKSMIAHIDSEFARVRIGISNEHMANQEATDFVLGQLTHEERQQWPNVAHEAIKLITAFIDPNQKFEHTSARIGS